MNYTLNQLLIFIKIKETCSITKAAEQLHLTQPAVSIQLKNFQDQFDIALTEVIGRQLFITDFGYEVAEVCERILNEVQMLNFEMAKFRGNLTGRLRLSVVSTGKYVIPYFLNDFMNKHPAIELQMDVTNKSHVVESLKNNEVDFAFVSVVPNHLPIESISLLKNQLFLFENGERNAEHQKTNLKNSAENKRFIFREKGSDTRNIMENYLNDLTISKPINKIELTSNEAVKQAVIAGLGCSIMPLIGNRNELSLGQLQIVPTEGLPITTEWKLIWLKNKRFSPVAKQFLDHIEINRTNIVERHFHWYESFEIN
jgi:DNA-binding transcriptional LysR family regulator